MKHFKKQRWIPELYQSLHRHDTNNNGRYKYEKDFLRRSTSNVLWKNPFLSKFMSMFHWMHVHLIDSISYVRNYYNPNVDRYYTDHLE